jgi:divalent metal cation (Fe/Co/Zn/Cd) transporter
LPIAGEKASAEIEAKRARQQRLDTILAKVVLAANVTILVSKVVAAILSHSLSIVSTVIDSGVDITSGLVMWFALN